MSWYTKLIRRWTRWAWQREADAAEGLAQIQEMYAKPGAMELAIKTDPALSQYIAMCFAELVRKSENYTEMKFDVQPANGEWLIVTVQKGKGKTPHQMRQNAEYERDAFKRDLQVLRERNQQNKQ